MKAAAIEMNGGPEVFAYRELPDPVCSDDGLVKPSRSQKRWQRTPTSKIAAPSAGL